MSDETKVVIGSFLARGDAQQAVQRLVDAGFPREALSVLTSSEPLEGSKEAPEHAPLERPSPIAENTYAGVTIGAAIGAMAAGLVGVGSLSMPDVGVVLAGSVVAALAGAGAGGIAGGLAGALVGFGIGASERRERASGRRARVVVAVETAHRSARAAVDILRAERSRDVAVR